MRGEGTPEMGARSGLACDGAVVHGHAALRRLLNANEAGPQPLRPFRPAGFRGAPGRRFVVVADGDRLESRQCRHRRVSTMP